MEDIDIIQLYFDRNEQAIPETAQKYGRYCTTIAVNILGSSEDAEECVNDTYMNTWDSIPPHKPERLSAFLGKIVRNLSINRLSYNTAEKRGGGELSAVLDELAECVSGSESIERELERKELVREIDSFLGALSPLKRSIFICRYWYSDSVADIARRYSMKENAVSMVLSRLRIKLRRHLTERGYEL